MTGRRSPVVALDELELIDLARRLIELTQEGNGAAAMALLEQAAGVDTP